MAATLKMHVHPFPPFLKTRPVARRFAPRDPAESIRAGDGESVVPPANQICTKVLASLPAKNNNIDILAVAAIKGPVHLSSRRLCGEPEQRGRKQCCEVGIIVADAEGRRRGCWCNCSCKCASTLQCATRRCGWCKRIESLMR